MPTMGTAASRSMRVLPTVSPPVALRRSSCRETGPRAPCGAARANDTAPGGSPLANVTRERRRRSREVSTPGWLRRPSDVPAAPSVSTPGMTTPAALSAYDARATTSSGAGASGARHGLRALRTGRPARTGHSGGDVSVDSRRSSCPAGSAARLGEPLELREVAVEMRADGLVGARSARVLEAHGDARAPGAEIGKRDQAALFDVVGERPLDVLRSRSRSGRRGCGT